MYARICALRSGGRLRRYSYRKYSEGRAAHWLLLLAADRVDTLESTLRSFATLHPDNLTVANFGKATKQVPYIRFFLNSIVVSTTITVAQLFTCSTAAYAFARLGHPLFL